MNDEYLLSTWTAPCACGREHRIIIIADNGQAMDDAVRLWADNLSFGNQPSNLVQHRIERDLVDGWFHDEYLP